MAQTPEGARKFRETMRRKYGANYYAVIGAKGGKASSGYGFAHGKVDPVEARKLVGKKK